MIIMLLNLLIYNFWSYTIFFKTNIRQFLILITSKNVTLIIFNLTRIVNNLKFK